MCSKFIAHYMIGDFLTLFNIRIPFGLMTLVCQIDSWFLLPEDPDFPTIFDKAFGFCSCNSVVKGPFH